MCQTPLTGAARARARRARRRAGTVRTRAATYQRQRQPPTTLTHSQSVLSTYQSSMHSLHQKLLCTALSRSHFSASALSSSGQSLLEHDAILRYQ